MPDRVPYGRSRAKGAGAGSRAVPSVACEKCRCRIACGTVGRGRKVSVPDRVPSRRSRAKGAGAGHGVRDGRRVRYGPSPDRVRYGPSPDRVSLCPNSFRRLRCPRPIHGRASRRPVVCHVPAQHGAVADAATGGVRTFILLYGRGVLSWRVRRRG